MITRVIITVAVIGLAFGAYAIGTRWQTSRIARAESASRILAGLRRGTPAVVYFWSESCAPCKAVQSPALNALCSELGPANIQVVEIDALRHPDIADEWGVLGLPTTFIVDKSGQPRHVNHGVTRLGQLRQQIAAFAG